MTTFFQITQINRFLKSGNSTNTSLWNGTKKIQIKCFFQEYGALRRPCFQMNCFFKSTVRYENFVFKWSVFFSRVRCVMKALLSNEVLFSRVRCVTRALVSNEVLFSRVRCVTKGLLSHEMFFSRVRCVTKALLSKWRKIIQIKCFFKSRVRYEGFVLKFRKNHSTEVFLSSVGVVINWKVFVWNWNEIFQKVQMINIFNSKRNGTQFFSKEKYPRILKTFWCHIWCDHFDVINTSVSWFD